MDNRTYQPQDVIRIVEALERVFPGYVNRIMEGTTSPREREQLRDSSPQGSGSRPPHRAETLKNVEP